MLPRLAGDTSPARGIASTSASGASRTTRAVTPACSEMPGLHDQPGSKSRASAVCAACPLAGPCLLDAVGLDVAGRLGRDSWGAYGCWAGVWFERLRSTANPCRSGAGRESASSPGVRRRAAGARVSTSPRGSADLACAVRDFRSLTAILSRVGLTSWLSGRSPSGSRHICSYPARPRSAA